MTYEKRLEAHQKAFSYVYPLSLRLTNSYFAFAFDWYDKIAFDREYNDTEIMRLLLELKNFYDSNCLYLDEQSRNEIIRAIVMTGMSFHDSGKEKISKEELKEELKAASDQLLKAQKAIVAGIGMKHIEEPKKEQPEGKS